MKVVEDKTAEGRVQLLVSLINHIKHFQLCPAGYHLSGLALAAR